MGVSWDLLGFFLWLLSGSAFWPCPGFPQWLGSCLPVLQKSVACPPKENSPRDPTSFLPCSQSLALACLSPHPPAGHMRPLSRLPAHAENNKPKYASSAGSSGPSAPKQMLRLPSPDFSACCICWFLESWSRGHLGLPCQPWKYQDLRDASLSKEILLAVGEECRKTSCPKMGQSGNANNFKSCRYIPGW